MKQANTTASKMSEEEQKEHIRMIFSASYYPFKNIDALVNNFYSWHQQELERAVTEAKLKARLQEHEMLQHQARINLKSAEAVAQWSSALKAVKRLRLKLAEAGVLDELTKAKEE